MKFWYIRDVMPATEANERLIEHYGRLNYARKKFPSLSSPGYDARGRIYIQYGPLDEEVVDTMPGGADPFETWAYYKFGAPVTFDFVRKGLTYRLALDVDEGIKFTKRPLACIETLYERVLRRASLSPAYSTVFMELTNI